MYMVVCCKVLFNLSFPWFSDQGKISTYGATKLNMGNLVEDFITIFNVCLRKYL